jgi:hypothetical protein
MARRFAVKSDWLAASNLERTHEILSAINTLSIHAKLALSDIEDPASATDIQRSRERLIEFLNGIEAVLEKAERERGAVIGTDPQLGELARRFLAPGPDAARRSRSADLPLDKLPALVSSERPEDLTSLVRYLERLRSLVEEQMHTDVADLPGAIPR